MTAPPNTGPLSPEQLASQLFDAVMPHMSDPREAARQVVLFLAEALVYAISSTSGSDEVARKATLKSIGDMIIAAPPLPAKAASKP